jgi:hypothetical protein
MFRKPKALKLNKTSLLRIQERLFLSARLHSEFVRPYYLSDTTTWSLVGYDENLLTFWNFAV